MKILRFILGSMRTNCYFLIDEKTSETIVVDPADDAELILDKLDTKKLKISKIILTHVHFDHMLALEPLRSATGAPLLVHADDSAALEDPTRSLFAQFMMSYTSFPAPDAVLNDKDIITFGNSSIDIMHTPGHTPGSICLLCGDSIISGDTLFRESIGRYDFPEGDYNRLMQSLKKLASLNGDYRVYPGHGDPTTLEHERTHNPYLAV